MNTTSKIEEKTYKLSIINNNSNLWIVSMLPGDRNGLPDAYHFLDGLGGSN